MPFRLLFGSILVAYIVKQLLLLQQTSSQHTKGIYGVIVDYDLEPLTGNMLMKALYPKLSQYQFTCNLVPDYQGVDTQEIVRRHHLKTNATLAAYQILKTIIIDILKSEFPSLYSLDKTLSIGAADLENLSEENISDISEWRLNVRASLSYYKDKYQNKHHHVFDTLPGNITHRIPNLFHYLQIANVFDQALQFNYTIQGYQSTRERDRFERWLLNGADTFSRGFADYPPEDLERNERINMFKNISKLNHQQKCIVWSTYPSYLLASRIADIPNKNNLILLRAAYSPQTELLKKQTTYDINQYSYQIKETSDAIKVADAVEQIIKASYQRPKNRNHFFNFMNKDEKTSADVFEDDVIPKL